MTLSEMVPNIYNLKKFRRECWPYNMYFEYDLVKNGHLYGKLSNGAKISYSLDFFTDWTYYDANRARIATESVNKHIHGVAR